MFKCQQKTCSIARLKKIPCETNTIGKLIKRNKLNAPVSCQIKSWDFLTIIILDSFTKGIRKQAGLELINSNHWSQSALQLALPSLAPRRHRPYWNLMHSPSVRNTTLYRAERRKMMPWLLTSPSDLSLGYHASTRVQFYSDTLMPFTC